MDGRNLPRMRKLPKCFDQGQSEIHVFQGVHEWCRKNDFTISYQVTASLKSRFDTVTSQAELLSLNDAILWILLFCTPVFSPECAGQGSECSGFV